MPPRIGNAAVRHERRQREDASPPAAPRHLESVHLEQSYHELESNTVVLLIWLLNNQEFADITYHVVDLLLAEVLGQPQSLPDEPHRVVLLHLPERVARPLLLVVHHRLSVIDERERGKKKQNIARIPQETNYLGRVAQVNLNRDLYYKGK